MENYPILSVESASSLESEKLFAAFLDGYGDGQLGSLIKGIVHNLNGSLQILSMQIEMLQRMLQKEERLAPAIQEKAEQCMTQVDEFRSVLEILMRQAVAREEKSPQRIHLNDILEEELAAARHNLFFKHQVQIEKAFSPALPSLHGIRLDFSQALRNCIQNAIEAMEDSERKELKICTEPGSGGAQITIQDTGCGLPRDLRPRLFQPFFTTKRGRHYGLGLYVSGKLLAPYQAGFRYTFQRDHTLLRMHFPDSPSSSGKKKK